MNAEKALLGALILQPSQVRECAKIVTPDDFADIKFGKLFAGLCQMTAMGDLIDPITVSNNIPAFGIPNFHAADMWALTSDAYTPYMALEYAKNVKNDSVKRSLRIVAATIMQEANDSSVEPLTVAAKATNMLEVVREGSKSGTLDTKLLGEILQGDDSYDWLIPGLLERQDRLIVTGPEGFGKTTFIRQIAILSAAGINPMTFDRIKPVNVLVIDAENTEKQWRRAVRGMSEMAANLGARDPREAIHIAAGKRIDITKGSHLSEIHNLIDVHKPDMVMIGPLYKLVPKAINTDDDAAPLIVALDSLRERGVCLLMEAHAGKANNVDGDRDLRPRGSAALLGWPEFGFGLKPVAGEKDAVQLSRWRGDRDERSWPKKMRRGGRWPWIPDEIFEMRG